MKAQLTWSETALVDPRVHIAALGLQLINVGAEVGNLGFEGVDFVVVRFERLVESREQQVWSAAGAATSTTHATAATAALHVLSTIVAAVAATATVHASRSASTNRR